MAIVVGTEQVAIFRTRDGFYAINNVCPHRGAPLNEGMVTEGAVTCPWHQWQFQLQDGLCRNIPGASVPAYPMEIREGTLWVDVEAKSAA
jgi:nitrite reductase (NADH) small subunit/3-phenylpropionate/trans-cinnamate dioxygenase ferredoxin subunit